MQTPIIDLTGIEVREVIITITEITGSTTCITNVIIITAQSIIGITITTTEITTIHTNPIMDTGDTGMIIIDITGGVNFSSAYFGHSDISTVTTVDIRC